MAAQSYSTPQFFRRMPNALLARYFHGKGLFADLDFVAMKPAKQQPLLAAWDALPDATQVELEAELTEVHALCDEGGWRALQEAASQVLCTDEAAAVVTLLAGLEDHAAQAMTAFLDHRTLWETAEQYRRTDALAYWKKLTTRLPDVDLMPVAVAKCLALSEAIKAYLQRVEHRGRNCRVEYRRRGGKDCFFAFPRDHATKHMEWADEDMVPRRHSPAFDLIFVYERARGALDLYCRRAPKAAQPLQDIFATTVLGMERLVRDPKDGKAYDLAPLLDPAFTFTRSLDSGIGDVQLRKMRLTRRCRTGRHLTLQAANTAALHAMLNEVCQSVRLADYELTQVELRAQVSESGRAKLKKVAFFVGTPDTCSLKHEGVDNLLRGMLVASRIEPRKPAVADVAAAAS